MKKSNIKKVAVIGLCCTIISTSAVFALTNNMDINKDIKIQINNEWVNVHNPFIENDRTMISINDIIEKLGLKVESDNNTNTVKIYNDDFTIVLFMGNSTAKVIKNENGTMTEKTYNLDASPKIIENQTFVPIRFIAETLGFQVGWDNTLRAVIIDTAGLITDESEKAQIKSLVKSFGESLKMVSLIAPEDIVKDSLKESYEDFVSPTLLEKWQSDPTNAPGRVGSSPWPERIDILSVEKLLDSEYAVNGNIIQMTSVEMTQGGIAAKIPITITIRKIDNKWLIDDAVRGKYEISNLIIYNNSEFGFYFTLPKSWIGYSIITDMWDGISLNDKYENQSGKLIYIRHPEWTKESPRQDIPVMIFTQKQWKSLNNEEFSVGAAPILPSKLGENSEYVFALPARYNYAFLTGFEEIEKILEGNPLQAFEIN